MIHTIQACRPDTKSYLNLPVLWVTLWMLFSHQPGVTETGAQLGRTLTLVLHDHIMLTMYCIQHHSHKVQIRLQLLHGDHFC